MRESALLFDPTSSIHCSFVSLLFRPSLSITKCQKLISPLLSVRHSLSLMQATAIPQNSSQKSAPAPPLRRSPLARARVAGHNSRTLFRNGRPTPVRQEVCLPVRRVRLRLRQAAWRQQAAAGGGVKPCDLLCLSLSMSSAFCARRLSATQSWSAAAAPASPPCGCSEL